MNLDDIEHAWHSPHNRPASDQLERDRLIFMNTLRRRNRGFMVGMTLVFVWLTWITVRLLWFLMWPDPAKDRIDFTREWAVVAFLMLPWLGAVFMVRQHRRLRTRHPGVNGSIADNLKALVNQSRGAEARLRSILLLHLVGIPLMALCVWQIRAVGKARPHELNSMVGLFVSVIAISVAGLAYSLYNARRERRRLEALVSGYQ